MVGSGLGVLAAVTAYGVVANGQATWEANQVNTTICQWQQLRAHVVRDTVYMDGGRMWWLPGLSDGSYAAAISDRNPLGLVYTLNFSKPFSTTDNMTAIFGTISKVSDGTAAKNLAPNYVDGAMLGNHEEWFLYGGLLRETREFSPPAATNVLAYQKYQYGIQKDGFLPGFVYDDLPEDMTRYVAYGASAAAPSENKAWYFSGLRAQGYGPIYEPSFNESLTATNVSNTLITLDMTTQLQETWKNETLPADTPGRANPELVWVPVGKQGILVALGGVVFPDFSSYLSKSPNEAESKAQSPGFMSTIDIYDVASGTWYRQETTGGPGQLTRGCAVVAPAQDYSSFNIYYYGGYSGLSQSQPFNDDVWVLSIPSFTWTKVAEGTTGGRAGHKCFMPYPDQMFVIGGYPPLVGSALTCLRETVRVLDLTTGTWRTSYDPSKWANYTIPEAVVSKIGGSPTGGATATAPSPSGFASTGLAAVFDEKYPTAKIVNYFPYKPQAANNNTNPDLAPDVDVTGGGGVPAFLPPVLGVVLGLMFLTMIAVLILLWRRRKLLRRRGGQSEAGTEDTNGHRIMSWMRGQTNSETKAGTVVSSDETTSSPDDLESVAPAHPQSMAEMMNTEIRAPVELPDTSPRPELHDTGLSHVDVLNRYSRLSEAVASHNSSSLNASSDYATSGTHQTDHASVAPSSASVGTGTIQARHMSVELPGMPVPSSPPPTSTTTVRGYIPSGVSNISERDRAHLRTISDTTVSSVASAPRDANDVDGVIPEEQEPTTPAGGTLSSPLPVSPPTQGESKGGDYITAGAATASAKSTPSRTGTGPNSSPTSPLRRSVFHESREDMTDTGVGPTKK
ncbi:RING finger protein B [Podospora aff. communis PSN243]|uniref:RING finger protein B n=1 Tax=Podospora aff. communis PSN243 TaxID=3040156 RepID=A0AAV9GRG1_9PEZI|nr:RING finger protein B [Podospora aff. communis PSN243]